LLGFDFGQCLWCNSSVCSHHADGDFTITSTYTNNVTGILSTKEGGQTARDKLGHNYKIKDLGNAKYILGIHVDQD
jgi:hypothetical protein